MKKKIPLNQLYKNKDDYGFVLSVPGFYSSMQFSKRELEINKINLGALEYFSTKLEQCLYSLKFVMEEKGVK